MKVEQLGIKMIGDGANMPALCAVMTDLSTCTPFGEVLPIFLAVHAVDQM